MATDDELVRAVARARMRDELKRAQENYTWIKKTRWWVIGANIAVAVALFATMGISHFNLLICVPINVFAAIWLFRKSGKQLHDLELRIVDLKFRL